MPPKKAAILAAASKTSKKKKWSKGKVKDKVRIDSRARNEGETGKGTQPWQKSPGNHDGEIWLDWRGVRYSCWCHAGRSSLDEIQRSPSPSL